MSEEVRHEPSEDAHYQYRVNLMHAPMIDLGSLAVVLVLCAMLSILSYRFELLTMSGSVASFVVGGIIGSLGSIGWLITLIAFTFLGFFVTKFRFQLKERMGLQEGRKGERTYRNVLANGLVPAVVAIVAFALGEQNSALAGIAFIASVSVAASDTAASELGVLSSRTYLITTFRRVPPGTDGGISAFGTACCVLGAAVASLVGWVIIMPVSVLDPFLLVPVAAGVAGCMIDSVIGATLERRGWVDKLGNNILSMAVGTILAVALYLSIV